MASDIAVGQLLSELRLFVDDLSLSTDVVDRLLPGGRPHDFETQIWDYKQRLPFIPPAPSDEDRRKFDAELGGLIKDIVSFHNALGGYLVFGIRDDGKNRIIGCELELDVGDLNKRLQAYTGAEIECLFRKFDLVLNDGKKEIGLLLVPRRASAASPVSFRKAGPEKKPGDRTFSPGIYVRIRDNCRPATATSEDWLFLHSDRNPTEASKMARRKLHTLLPAREPDLIQFVGRDSYLEKLRAWLGDPRSPVRLISGIGGLGKTTLAYRFVEEVVAASPEDIEWIIWLTAKQTTYSGLLGRYVETARTDFSDLMSLLRGLLRALSYDLAGDEEADLDALIERMVEALETYSCLLVVDDIDSLSPDEQRETIATLNAIALRTVGREIPPSRILLTSRIDQGLSPTAVIKIEGLDREAFDKHVINLCETFKIAPIYGSVLDDMYKVTSGSPLFVASVIRLVSLGEPAGGVLDVWRGQDGEDIRRFAFEREVGRLDTIQSRLLYAVLLLGETSLNDLAGVLDVTPKVVRDRISELQAYHLLATTTKANGDAIIFAPGDLDAIKEILRKHLGSNAIGVENACRRAQEIGQVDNRSVGLGIRTIVAMWDADDFESARLAATALRDKYPKSGDVVCIFGAALMRCGPQYLQEADNQLRVAEELGCMRYELSPYRIRVKTALKDWQGLRDLTASLLTNDGHRDEPLEAYIRATAELISIAKDRRDPRRVSELAISAVEKIARKISKRRLQEVFFEKLHKFQLDFAREYIVALQQESTRPGDGLNLFEGVVRLSGSHVVLTDLVLVGVAALEAWWKDVEGRPVLDTAVCSILARQLRRLQKLEVQISGFKVGNVTALLRKLESVRRELEYRGAQLMS